MVRPALLHSEEFVSVASWRPAQWWSPRRPASDRPSTTDPPVRVGAAIPSDPPAGDVPHGYTFLRHHRQGGFGSVIVVRDHRTAREVALKWLHSGLRPDAHCRELIEAEARLTASLQHPNIVPVYDIGENADGHFYYTMRLVPGLTLDEYLDLLTAERTSFPSDSDLRRLVDCLRKICDAVMYAHARGVLHLDLKPSNILVGDFGEVLLVDWGCAAKLTIGGGPAAMPAGSTPDEGPGQGRVRDGTPAHMAPEQFDGPNSRVGPETDVYQLGGVLYEILTLSPPDVWWQQGITPSDKLGPRRRLPWKVATRGCASPLGGALHSVSQRALARDAGKRYQSVQEFASDIDHWFANEPVSAYRERLTERFCRFIRSHPEVSSVLAASTALVILFNVHLLRVTTQGYSETLASLVAGQGRATVGGVSALQGLFESRAQVLEPGEFRALARFYHESFPGTQAYSWVPRVTGSERSRFVENVRTSALARGGALTAYSISERYPAGDSLGPAANRETYYPVLYIEPLDGNEAALGFNLASDGARWRMLASARASKSVSLSRPLDLVQATAEEVGLLAAAPVRLRGHQRPAVDGYITSVIMVNDLLNASWREIDIEHVSVRVYDVTRASSPILIWDNEGEDAEHDDPKAGAESGVFSRHTELVLFNRRWSVWVRPRPSFLLSFLRMNAR